MPTTTSTTITLNGQTYPIDTDPQSYTAAELNAVERATGMTLGEFAEKLQDPRMSSLAWTALAWIAVRRGGRDVGWDEFEQGTPLQDIFSGLRETSTEPANRAARRAKSPQSRTKKGKPTG